MKGKDDVFHSPEPYLSQGSVNHAGVVVTSGKLWEEGFRSEPSGGCAILLLLSLWLLLYLYNKLSVPPTFTTQHHIFIKLSLCSHLPCFSGNWAETGWPTIDPLPQIKRYVVGSTLVVVGNCLVCSEPLLWCYPSLQSFTQSSTVCGFCQLKCSSELEYEWLDRQRKRRNTSFLLSSNFARLLFIPLLPYRLFSSAAPTLWQLHRELI